MISDFFYNLYKIIKSRVFIVCLIFVVAFGALIFRIFDLQIVNEKFYMSTYIQQAEKSVYTPGTRGNIYDVNGKLLAYDTLAYVVTIEDTIDSSVTKNKELNKIAENTIKVIEKYGDKVIVDFPIIMKDNSWEYNFTSDSAKNLFIKNIFGKDTVRDNVDYSQANAAEMLNYLKNDLFEIKDYEDTDFFLKVISIRYNLYLNSYKKYVSTTIAENVCKETVVAINENEADIPGVKIEEKNIRRYNDSLYFAPILGYTGTISDDELASYKEEGKDYIASDMVGKSGIELTMEDELKGTSGEEKIFVDSTGKKLSTISKKNSRAGNNVYLSIDSKLQKAAYKLLEKKIISILLSEIVNYDVKEDIDNDDDIHYISAKTVYSRLVTNNVVNITKLSKNASDNEKRLNKKYKDSVLSAAKKVKKQLLGSGTRYKDLNNEFKEYNDYIYDVLKNNGILITSTINTEDDIYQDYVAGKTTTNKFLRHAITQNWINLDNIKDADDYLSTDETYDLLVDYIYKTFKKDPKFGKSVVKYRVYDGTINGAAICLLLFDQKVLPKNKSEYNSLQRYDSYATYHFMIKQIKKATITPAQLALDPCSGSVVVTDPNNGRVKALVTYPSYDNNMLSGTVDPEYWAKLVDDQSDPLYNRATQGLTAPGSTFKMCTAMTALERDTVSLSETVNCKGKYKKVKPSPKCWIYPNAHGSIDIDNAIAQSCNYFFYEMGYRLGKSGGSYDSAKGLERMEKYATKLGLNVKSGVEITESEPHFSTESSIHSAIGQGSHAYAPVQLARYVSTLANGGKNYQLSLINKITSTNNKTVSKNKSVLSNTIDASASTWDAIHKGMRGVITYGTVFKYFNDTKIKIAAKTGTAQENKKRNSHALFVAYAPYKKPKIAVSAVIPYGNSSHDSAELGKEVIQYSFGELKDKDINKKVKKAKISSGLQD